MGGFLSTLGSAFDDIMYNAKQAVFDYVVVVGVTFMVCAWLARSVGLFSPFAAMGIGSIVAFGFAHMLASVLLGSAFDFAKYLA